MKTLYLSLIIFTMIIFLTFGIGQAHADNVNDVYVQNITTQPSKVKVGDAFAVTITLVNNSTVPIWLDGGKCSSEDIQASFFTIIFDNHAKIKGKDIFCAGVGWSQILDPGKNITATSPDYTATYIATEPGTANATMTFSYHVINQTDPTQPGFSGKISKSFQFTILDNNTGSSVKLEKVLLSPLQQFRSGVAPKDVICKEGFMLITKASNNLPACVTQQTYYKLVSRGWTILQNTTTTAWVFVNGTRYDIPYVIRGWNNDLASSITFNSEHKSLIVPIKSVAEKGEITLTIPRSLLDSNLGQDTPFVVSVDGQVTKHIEVTSYTARMLTIPFGFGVQEIEIFAPQRI